MRSIRWQAAGAVNGRSVQTLAGFNTDVTGFLRRFAVRSQADRAPPQAPSCSARAARLRFAALGELGIVTLHRRRAPFRRTRFCRRSVLRLGVSIDQGLWSDHDAVLRAISGADLVSTLPAG